MKETAIVQQTPVFVCSDIARWVDSYLLAKKAQGLSGRTVEFYEEKLRGFVAWCLARSIDAPEKITPTILREFILVLQERHNPGGVHGFYRAIRAFLTWYTEEDGPIGWENPVRRVQAPRVPENILAPVSVEDVHKLTTACGSGWDGSRDRAIFLVLFDCGLRASEIRSLELSDFDPYSGSIRVRLGKGGRGRTAYTGTRTRRAIRVWLKERGNAPGPLFPSRHNSRFTYTGLRSIVLRRSKVAGIKPPPLHAFRRAFAINLIRHGADVISVARLLGHRDLSVVKQYVALQAEDLMDQHARHSPADNAW